MPSAKDARIWIGLYLLPAVCGMLAELQKLIDPDVDLKINGEPEHSLDVFCWCGPTVDGDIVIHRSLAEIWRQKIQ